MFEELIRKFNEENNEDGSTEYIKDPEGQIQAKGDVYLYGKEINDETYAICKSDMMIKGNNPENIRVGSTLSTDEFSAHRFDFMLSNPPYGKSWNSEVKYIKDGKDVIDPRFQVELADYWGNKETVDAILWFFGGITSPLHNQEPKRSTA